MLEPTTLPLDELRSLYELGWSLSAIAERYPASSQTIGRRLRAAGVELRGHYVKTDHSRARMSDGRRLNLPEDELRRLHGQRMSCQEIADLLGCSNEKVREDLVRLNLPRLPARARPDRNYFWQGGYAIDNDGYILRSVPEHPHANSGGYVREHRLVMERKLGRHLLRTEVVDHRNGDTSDNREQNLRVFATNGEHLRATRTGRAKLPAQERERLRRAAVQRARQRVESIRAATGTGADPLR